MSQANAILGLLTETSLHAGIGQTLDVIDLPIQREAHTNWPFVYASSVKGSMRSLAEEKWDDKELIKKIFGPEMNHGTSNRQAGALAIGDARLLLLPVRSLTSHFKWVTSPDLLRRFLADCRRLDLAKNFKIPETIAKEEGLVSNEHDIDFGLFLEEFPLKLKTDEQLDTVITTIASLMGREDAERALKRQLVMVNDDIFSHLSRYATAVNAHIKIGDTRTVQKGALWYEETLPPDTLLYVPLVAQAVNVIEQIQNLFEHPYLQLGGHETVGMGWCKIEVVKLS
ncbi:MAG: type III-B CRISPR module RAMP protein Cmr4 [Pseudomonadota bacterium]